MGAGIVECDTTFTSDGELVCRHSECDLHTTTNIVATALNAKCSVPWTGPGQNPPAVLHERPDARGVQDAAGKMDAPPRGDHGRGLPGRHPVLAYRPLHGPRHADDAAREHRPQREKRRQAHAGAEGRRPGAHQADLRRAGAVRAEDDRRAARLRRRPAPRLSAVLRPGRRPLLDPARAGLRPPGRVPRQRRPDPDPPIPRPDPGRARQLRAQGVRIFAPPMPALLDVDAAATMVPSQYARDIRSAGFKIITWTFERADLRQGRFGRASTTTSIRRAAPSRRTATCTRRSTCWRGR